MTKEDQDYLVMISQGKTGDVSFFGIIRAQQLLLHGTNQQQQEFLDSFKDSVEEDRLVS
jgi:hypothetical protein